MSMPDAQYAASQATATGVGVGGPLLAALWANATATPWWAPLILGSGAVVVPIFQSWLAHDKLVTALRDEIRELRWEIKALRKKHNDPPSDDAIPNLPPSLN